MDGNMEDHRRNKTSEELIDSLNKFWGASKVKKLLMGKQSIHSTLLIEFNSTVPVEKIISTYQQTNLFEYVEVDQIGTGGGIRKIHTNDAFYSRQWSLNNDGTFAGAIAKAGADIDMEKAWDIETGDSSIIVGILDSGCKLDHPELKGRIWKHQGDIANNGIDDDSNGYIDDVYGWDFAYNDNDPTDDYGHGTNIAGIIGCNGNNNIGYAGVDRHCKLMILKVLDNQNQGFYSWWASAIYYAVDHGAKVINLSLGGTSQSALIQEAVDYAYNHGAVIVACMMNTNTDQLYYPAACENVMAVGATNPDDTRCAPFFWDVNSGSNFGNHLSVVAPGNFIYGLDYTSDNQYNSYWGGTSQAAPHVSAIASLLLAQDPSRTPTEIKNIIEFSAEDLVGNIQEDKLGWDKHHGFGRVNAYQALSPLATPVEKMVSQLHFNLIRNDHGTSIVFHDHVSFPMHYVLINSLGKEVKVGEIDRPVTYLSLPYGIYFLFLFYENHWTTEKIILE